MAPAAAASLRVLSHGRAGSRFRSARRRRRTVPHGKTRCGGGDLGRRAYLQAPCISLPPKSVLIRRFLAFLHSPSDPELLSPFAHVSATQILVLAVASSVSASTPSRSGPGRLPARRARLCWQRRSVRRLRSCLPSRSVLTICLSDSSQRTLLLTKFVSSRPSSSHPCVRSPS